MKKSRFLLVLLFVVACFFVTSCGVGGATYVDYDGTEVQGITEDKIYIGNTAPTTGAFSTVGVPFNIGLNAALKVYNDKGGFNGKTVELINYDDEFTAEKGLTLTKKLVEEDQVFALVGHFGTPTVGATVDYIASESGIPMVYAATGISDLYNTEAKGYERAVMSVQPIYDAEGRVLLARAVASTEDNYGLGGTNIGVISTTDEAGMGMLSGIEYQAKKLNVDVKYVKTSSASGTNHATAVNTLKAAGCDVIIVAANQAPFQEIMGYMRDGGLDNVKVITSYVSASASDLQALEATGCITATREVYTAAWLDITSQSDPFLPANGDITTFDADLYLWYCYGAPLTGVAGFSKDYWDAAVAIADYLAYDIDWTFADVLPNDGDVSVLEYSYNSYALAGYIAGYMFVQGLERVQASGVELTWKNYIDAMESAPISVPMGGSIDFANGARLGITDLALNRYQMSFTYEGTYVAGQLVTYSGIKSLDDIIAHIAE